MRQSDFTFTASDRKAIYVHRWLPDAKPRALLVVAHGMAEHAARYARLAETLTAAGWAVYAPDHRGHGKTATEAELGWFAEKDGFRRVVDDLHEIALAAKAEYPGLPFLLFGHSMGSVLSEAYLGIHGKADGLDGCALSGVVEPPAPALRAVGNLLAGLGRLLKGSRSKAPLLDSMSFGANNKPYEPARTKFEWLSRDPAEVDKYIADPLCGFICTDGFYCDFLDAFAKLYGKGGWLESAPADVPVMIMAGQDDPAGTARGFADALAERLRGQGIADIQVKTYPGARHEILNETNRDEVTRDLAAWLESKARA